MENTLYSAEMELLEFGLSLPEAWEDFPWNERHLRVRKRIFVALGMLASPKGSVPHLRITVKLPESYQTALIMPFAHFRGYNIGKPGWVTARFAPGETPPVPLLMEWIEESYRAIAPKRLVAALSA